MYLILSVVGLRVLNDSVAETEEVVHGIVSLVCQVSHLECGLHLQRDPQQVEDLKCLDEYHSIIGKESFLVVSTNSACAVNTRPLPPSLVGPAHFVANFQENRLAL